MARKEIFSNTYSALWTRLGQPVYGKGCPALAYIVGSAQNIYLRRQSVDCYIFFNICFIAMPPSAPGKVPRNNAQNCLAIANPYFSWFYLDFKGLFMNFPALILWCLKVLIKQHNLFAILIKTDPYHSHTAFSIRHQDGKLL